MDRPLDERIKVPGRQKSDLYQTPGIAIEPLIGFLPQRIWECACGKGNLVRAFLKYGFKATGTDIGPRGGYGVADFLSYKPLFEFDAIVTNPPYSLKDEFLERCYWHKKPFALLMKITALEGLKRQALYKEHGMQLMVLSKRINYETPHDGNSGAWFASAWFTWGLNLPSDLYFAEL